MSVERSKFNEIESPHLIKMRGVIENSPREMQAEFERSKNAWLARFHTRLSTLASYVSLLKLDPEYNEQQYAVLESKMEKVAGRYKELKAKYPHSEPSEEEQEELMVLFNNIVS